MHFFVLYLVEIYILFEFVMNHYPRVILLRILSFALIFIFMLTIIYLCVVLCLPLCSKIKRDVIAFPGGCPTFSIGILLF